MENASKALLMAAGLLIGLLILSLAVYLFASFGSASAEAHRQNAENQINQFNAQFTAYEGRTDLTIHDIVTATNLAKSNNTSYNLTLADYNASTNNLYIAVIVGSQHYETKTSEELDNLIRNDINQISGSENYLPTYRCVVEINEGTQRVRTVTFISNN